MNTEPPSSYRGVLYHNRDKHYRVRVKYQGQSIHLKTWKDPEVAARVYDCAASMLHGPDAQFNFDGNPPLSVPKSKVRMWLLEAGVRIPQG